MKITRKQAVLRAIEVLSESKENYEICKVLESLAEELPLSHWTEKSILDATNQFLNEYGKLPSALDFNKVGYLPNRCTIKNKLGLNMEEFYKKYYSTFYYNNNSIYNHKDINHWINLFKEQYIKHDKPTLNNFDKVRDEGTPCVTTYCKITGVNTWNELLEYCGFSVIGQNIHSKVRPKRKKTNYTIVCDFNPNVSVEELQEINDKIKKIISARYKKVQ